MGFDDDNTFGGMSEDEFFLLNNAMLEDEEEEELQRQQEEDEEYERQKDEDLSHIVFEQERVNRRSTAYPYAGGGCCSIALLSMVIGFIFIIYLVLMLFI